MNAFDDDPAGDPAGDRMRTNHSARFHHHFASVIAGVSVSVLAMSGCAGSKHSAGASAEPSATAAASVTPSPSTPPRSPAVPAHDYNVPAVLAAAVKVQWQKETADPSNAHYKQGVTVTKVVCAPSKQPKVFDCAIKYSRGEPYRQFYLVSADGQSFEGVESPGIRETNRPPSR